jgi:uncharacterized membrane protein
MEVTYYVGGFISWLLITAGLYMSFQKAGEAGWKAIIPIYNLFVQVRLAEKPVWWVILALIPIIRVVVDIAYAERFGKGVGFAIGLLILPFIFYPILGFDSSQYRRRQAAAV